MIRSGCTLANRFIDNNVLTLLSINRNIDINMLHNHITPIFEIEPTKNEFSKQIQLIIDDLVKKQSLNSLGKDQ